MAPLLITILVKSVVFVAGPAISEIEEIVKDTALSLIGVESLENDEPLMDAGAPACPARSRAPRLMVVCWGVILTAKGQSGHF